MALRVSGINSGLDTDAIVSELVSGYSKEVESLQKQKTLLEWQQEAWQDINADIYKFYNSTLSQMRNASTYQQVKSTSSDESVLKVTAGTNSTNGIQQAHVEKLASAGYLTGGTLTASSGSDKGTTPSASTKISEIAGMENLQGSFYVKSADGAAEKEITIDANTTLEDLTNQLSKAGLNASYDEGNGRIFISSKKTGEANDFELIAKDENAENILAGLKLTGSEAHRIDGEDAVMVVNGAKYTSSNNTFSINGMTFTATGVSEKDGDTYKSLTINTETDYDGIYDTIKGFIKEYNTLVNKLDSLYNAKSPKGLNPLTDEEKEAMSEAEVEKWEGSIKDGLLSGDSTVSSVVNSMFSVMMGTTTVGGKEMHLSDFGIGSLSYFTAAENEKHAYYIDGDKDSPNTAGNKDKLMTMIGTDPDTVMDFFSSLSQNMWKNLDSQMKSSSLSSVYKVYNDKQMKTEYDSYTTKISDAEKRLTEYEDYWYSKFTSMETALASLNSKQSALGSLFGM